MDLDDVITGLADMAWRRLSPIQEESGGEDASIRDAHLLLEAAETLRRQAVLLEGTGYRKAGGF